MVYNFVCETWKCPERRFIFDIARAAAARLLLADMTPSSVVTRHIEAEEERKVLLERTRSTNQEGEISEASLLLRATACQWRERPRFGAAFYCRR